MLLSDVKESNRVPPERLQAEVRVRWVSALIAAFRWLDVYVWIGRALRGPGPSPRRPVVILRG
jgi:hypothetical protein